MRFSSGHSIGKEGEEAELADVELALTHAASLRRTPHQNSSSIETLLHALQRERGSFSNCPRRHAHSPALPWFGSEVGTLQKGLDPTAVLKFSRKIKKGRYAPLVASRPNCCDVPCSLSSPLPRFRDA